MTPAREAQLRALEDRLGHRFEDLSVLDRALTHSSRANEEPAAAGRHNEPLEFLGDSVIGFVMADLLHRRDPDGREGAKSKLRGQLVSARSLARRAAELGLPDLLLLGRGEEKTGGRKKTALWADAYEAVIAALYLDGGLEAAHRFVSAEFAADLERPAMPTEDHKSTLQEILQARGDPVPEYELVAEEGPDHRRRFRVRCLVRGEALAEGEGFSKKQAQQEAARNALARLAG
ncbi:MAG: ribonuclease III [Acidobacteria bacterium]|nr:MAG: ribonuclease III [Acidobacteriota bacterium]PYQ23965.1 MAG: ribonuclease III [Acidobacteriota bacterium]